MMTGESAAESSCCRRSSLSFTEMDPSLELMRQFEELNSSSMEMMGCFSEDYSLTRHHQQPELCAPFPDLLQLPSSLPKAECQAPALLPQPMASVAEGDRKKKGLEALEECASADRSLSGLTQTKIQRNKNSSESRKRGRGNSKEADKSREVVHVRARRGQATDSHSLAERSRRERINERMRFLQDLVPGCYKSMGMAGMLDEIINYVQSLQNQVEFLSLKLSAASSLYDVYCLNDTEAFAAPQLQAGNGQETVGRMMGDEYGGELTGFSSAMPL